MAVDRFIHFISVTALTSGLLCAVVPSLADGGGSDRLSIQDGAAGRNAASSVSRPVEHVADVIDAPLPPRRPRDLEATFAASQPAPSDASESPGSATVASVQPEAAAPQSVIAPPGQTMQPAATIPVAQPPAASAPVATIQPTPAPEPVVVPGVPVKPQSTPPHSQGGMGMRALSAWPLVEETRQFQHAAPPPENPAEAVIEGGKAVIAPLPPTRPVVASDVQTTPAELATLPPPVSATPAAATPAGAAPPGVTHGAISIAQPQPVAVAEAPEAAVPTPVAVPLPPVRPRLLTSLVPASATESNEPDVEPAERTIARVGYMPQPRGKSRLNHIIGDDHEAANDLRTLISKHASANGIPYQLADAVVRVESRYNPAARNGPYMGLMQIHPRTAASLGYGGDARGLLDSETNLQYGIKYLAMAYRLAGGDTCGTIMRYQGGHRSVSMTAANRTYCNKVKMIIAENHR